MQGHPFMENLKENRLLLYSIMIPSILVVMLSMGFSSDLTNTFEIVDFPIEVNNSNISNFEITIIGKYKYTMFFF